MFHGQLTKVCASTIDAFTNGFNIAILCAFVTAPGQCGQVNVTNTLISVSVSIALIASIASDQGPMVYQTYQLKPLAMS